MSTELFFLLLLVLHLLVSLVFFLLIKLGLLQISAQLFFLVLLVPAWGAAIALAAEWCVRRGRAGAKPVQLSRLQLAAEDYRAVSMAEEGLEKEVIPLEEAILINDAETRRKLMVDILRQQPGQYVDLLQKARLNDDIEVTHYAATAMMELQREYDLKLQQYERMLEDQPDNRKAAEDYAAILKAYIGSGLLSGNTLYLQRVRYKDILSKRLGMRDAGPEIYCDAADNFLELADTRSAKAVLDGALSKWPGEERAWTLLLKYARSRKDGALLRQTIAEMKKRRLALSPQTRDALRFWNRSPD